MIKIYKGSEATTYINQITGLSVERNETVAQSVNSIISNVRAKGDEALKEYALQFDDYMADSFLLSQGDIEKAVAKVSDEHKAVLNRAAENIRVFAQAIVESLQPVSLEQNGFEVGLDYVPVESAGCYIPGGRFPLPSTALMTAITAQAAGVKNIVMTTPDPQPEVLYAGTLAGVETFYTAGGAQAIAALTFGTETIKPVDIIVGPGNAYVTEAKRQLQGMVGIDMLAGPSEVAIIADETADPNLVAIDLLSQSEHDPDARSWLLTSYMSLAQKVIESIEKLKKEISLPNFIDEALSSGAILIFDTVDDCVEASKRLAPEHLHLNVDNPEELKPSLKHFGSLFMGQQATVPFGDYMAGPNHTLPTGQSARFSSGLSPLTFMRTQTWMQPTGSIEHLARDTSVFADLEGLLAHAAAAKMRMNKA